jgi:two-component system NtrC family sensor kinase
MKRTSLALLFFLITKALPAQDVHYIDSLKQTLSTSKEDTNKVKLYVNLSEAYHFSYPDSALVYSLPGLQLARKLNFKEGEFNVLITLGVALMLKGNYSKALEAELKALEIAQKLNDHEKVETSFIAIGCVYFYSGDYQKALHYLEKIPAGTNKTFGSPKFLLGLIGETYFHLNKLDSALSYIAKAYDLDMQSSSHWSVPYTYMGAIYDKKGNPLLALEYYREGNKVAIFKVDAINGYNGMASVFKKMGMKDSAIYYSKKVIAEGLNASIISPVLDASKLLTDIYKSKHFTDSALKYQELMLAAKDSLFSQEKVKQLQNLSFNEQLRQQEIQQTEEQYKNRIKTYILLGGIAVLLLLAGILYRNNKQKQKAKVKIEKAYEELKSTQAQLIQSEKMASLGELTAGIAHEIQNPLNFVNNFSEVNTELLQEMKQEIGKGNLNEVESIANDVIDNEQKINHHGKRADAIVKGMLQHSRVSTGEKEPTDINALADEYLRLAYHGLRAKDNSFNVAIKTHFDETIGKINIIPQDIGRVLLNLYNNAFYVVTEKTKQQGEGYEPTVAVRTNKLNHMIEISVKDNGNGIPQRVIDKIFHPFFTTKPTGQGTGLGLSLSYDIIKSHGGEIKVETQEGEGAAFIISLPMKENI